MRKLIYFLPLLALVIACTPKAAKVTTAAPMPPVLTTFVDSVSYVIGADMIKNLQKAIPKGEKMFDNEMFKLGFDDESNGQGRISEEDGRKLLEQFQRKMQAAAMAQQKEEAATAKLAGATYLAENAKKEGVMTTASGLQYKILKPGTGASPKASDQVEVHYEGRLVNGDVFDSSYQRGSTSTFGVGQVIKGWTEGLQLMKEGAKYQFYIPSNLAYGERGSPPKISPSATLVFDVELIKVK